MTQKDVITIPPGERRTFRNRPSLWETFPAIADELADPSEGWLLTAASKKRPIWVCPDCQFAYRTEVANRTSKNSGCPACAGKTTTGHNCLATVNWNLACELLNFDEALEYTANSHKKLEWVCNDCEFVYSSLISSRTRGQGCPACCTPPQVVTGHNCLATTHWDLAGDLLDFDNAFEFTHSSRTKVEWVCRDCEYIYSAAVYSRADNNSGCPACDNKVVTGHNSIATTHWDLSLELVDSELAFELTAGSGKKVLWECSDCNFVFSNSPNQRTSNSREKKCGSCSGKTTTGHNSLATCNWDLAQELLNFELAYEFTAGSKKNVDWECPECEYIYPSSIDARNRGNGCPACANNVVTGHNCLATTHWDLAQELFEFEDALQVTYGSKKLLQWICRKCDTPFPARPNDRSNKGSRCPSCSNSSKMNSWMIDLLKDLGIPFMAEWRHDKCRDKNPLPFDAAIGISNNNGIPDLLIECQGIQHFQPFKWHKKESEEEMINRFKGVQKRDAIKQTFADTSKIPLIEIRYDVPDFHNQKRNREKTFKRYLLTQLFQAGVIEYPSFYINLKGLAAKKHIAQLMPGC